MGKVRGIYELYISLWQRQYDKKNFENREQMKLTLPNLKNRFF